MPPSRTPNPELQSLSEAMQRACREARHWLGATSPNPAVGAVALDEQGKILAAASHRRAGEDHAEAALLKLCRDQNLMPRVHTMVVTLEPCNHVGRTLPCSESIIKSGIRHVVVGTRDPNPVVTGGGCERLRQAGIDVIEGIETESCRRLIHAFAFFSLTGKPFVTVKRAFDERGSMIPPKGQKTFTSQESLTLAHRLRKKADAIVTGSGTILADNPLFTVRHVEDYPGKRRILAILDRRGRVPQDYMNQAAERRLDAIAYQDLDFCFSDLAHRGVQDVLVECGPHLSQSILNSPHWTMCIDVHKEKTEITNVLFNNIKIPFNINEIDIDSLLPL
jgi:diaminohydroxyphosphoribosylaminopyrimidine deaminase / 5-amino-6-(5-phosphoribosylamino)uracil reductase